MSGWRHQNGGPGRTRTSNQTVMSGLADLGNSAKSDVFRHVRCRLFTSVHGVSVVNLWSVPAFPNVMGGPVMMGQPPKALARICARLTSFAGFLPRPAFANAAVGAPLQETPAMFALSFSH
jgi:hypothetical protein